MLLINTTFVLTLLGTVSGFVVPTGLPDGGYFVTEGADTPIPMQKGHALAFAARDAAAHPHSPRSLPRSLDNPIVSCDGFSYSSVDYPTAFNASLSPLCYYK